MLVPLVHHALRANGVALPSEVMLAASMGGRVAEEAWRRILPSIIAAALP
eukprot:COSAG02_NODE_26391_length_634_cov_0.884112_1_plen_49_part_10